MRIVVIALMVLTIPLWALPYLAWQLSSSVYDEIRSRP